ncbi:MAG TPA: hypothetical protein VME67_01830 [Mycobacterium sp.]|nr:hypothetical protein [Mycobacterium sp.]HTX93673.1 hypothetical protein [Mycobacterium sp.]
MATERSSVHRPGWSVWVAGGALMAAMLGQVVLAAPPASANCNLTAEDEQYIHLLGQNNMIHTADFNDCRLTTEGRWLANQVRTAADPMARAKSLMTLLTDTTSMDAKQAEWEVESAVFVYAPEMVPKIKDEAAQQAPAES